MTARRRALLELAVAGAASAAAVAAWLQVQSVVAVAPIMDGQPVTHSVVYDPPLLLLTLLLATLAGVLAVTGMARWQRNRRHHTP